MYDESTCYVLARSVLRPAEGNKRVCWDPTLQRDLQDTARSGGDTSLTSLSLSSKPPKHLKVEALEEVPASTHTHSGETTSSILDWDLPMIDQVEHTPYTQSEDIMIDDPAGEGLLAFASDPLPLDPTINKLKRKNKQKRVQDPWMKQSIRQKTRKSKRVIPKRPLLKRKPKKRDISPQTRGAHSTRI